MDPLEEKRRKLLCYVARSVQAFQRSIIIRRRRSQQRLARRRALLCEYFKQQMFEIEKSSLGLLTIFDMFPDEGNAVASLAPTFAANITNETKTNVNKESLLKGQQNKSFYHLAVRTFSEAQWLSAFRMSRNTFNWLCAKLEKRMSQGSDMPIPVRVAVALYVLVSGDESRVVALLFNLPTLAVPQIVIQFADDLLTVLGECLLTMPKAGEEYDEIRANFQAISGLPPVVVGVVGVCELPLKVNEAQVKEEQMRDHKLDRNSIVLHTLIDDRMLFRKVEEDIGPILLIDDPNEISTLDPILHGSNTFASCVIAPLYPMRSWMLRRYSDPVATHQIDFNNAADKVLALKDAALLRLFARWHILKRKWNLQPQEMVIVAKACCALHNLTEENEETYDETWADGVEPNCWNSFRFNDNKVDHLDSRGAVEIRLRLARIIHATTKTLK